MDFVLFNVLLRVLGYDFIVLTVHAVFSKSSFLRVLLIETLKKDMALRNEHLLP